MAFCLKLSKGRTFLIGETLIVSSHTVKIIVHDSKVVLPKNLEPKLLAAGWKLNGYTWIKDGKNLTGEEAKALC